MKLFDSLLRLALSPFKFGFADYHHDQPDTPANQKGFAKHLGLGQMPTEDVKGLYYFADQMGADCWYQLRFECSPETCGALVQSLNLTNSPDVKGKVKGREFPWWDAQAVSQFPMYGKVNAKEDYYKLLWYDQKSGVVYYLEFSV